MIVIGLLRFLGLVNAAAWLGAMIFLMFVASPASHSPEMEQLLGPRNSPFFSEAINQLMTARFFALFLVCSLLAFLHMGAERLYLGKQPKRFWLALLLALALGGIVQLYGVQPMLKHRWLVSHSPGAKVELREKAERSFRLWHSASTGFDVLLLAALSTYFWRVAHPPDEMRFVGASNLPGKFRS